jgi:hypothetical protein
VYKQEEAVPRADYGPSAACRDGYLGLDNIEQSPEMTNVEIAQRKESVWVMFVMLNSWILE